MAMSIMFPDGEPTLPPEWDPKEGIPTGRRFDCYLMKGQSYEKNFELVLYCQDNFPWGFGSHKSAVVKGTPSDLKRGLGVTKDNVVDVFRKKIADCKKKIEDCCVVINNIPPYRSTLSSDYTTRALARYSNNKNDKLLMDTKYAIDEMVIEMKRMDIVIEELTKKEEEQ